MSTTTDYATASRRLLEEGFNDGNLALADELIAPDADNHDPATPPSSAACADPRCTSGPWPCTARPSRTCGWSSTTRSAPTTRSCSGGTAKAPTAASSSGLAPTGARASVTGISIDQWRDGKVVEAWVEWDNLGLARQLGAAPPEGSMGEKLGMAVQKLMARRMRAKNPT